MRLKRPFLTLVASNIPIGVVYGDTWDVEWSQAYQRLNRDGRVGAVGMLSGSGALNIPTAISPRRVWAVGCIAPRAEDENSHSFVIRLSVAALYMYTSP